MGESRGRQQRMRAEDASRGCQQRMSAEAEEDMGLREASRGVRTARVVHKERLEAEQADGIRDTHEQRIWQHEAHDVLHPRANLGGARKKPQGELYELAAGERVLPRHCKRRSGEQAYTRASSRRGERL